MSDTDKSIYAQLAVDMYYEGALEALGVLSKAVTDMPDQSQRISMSEILVVISTARQGVIAKRDSKADPDALITSVLNT